MSDLPKENQKIHHTTFAAHREKQFTTPLQRTVGLKQTLDYIPRSEAVPTPPQRTRSLKSRLKCPQVESTSSLHDLQGSLDSFSSFESKSTSLSPETAEPLTLDEDSWQPRSMRRKHSFQPDGQSPNLRKKSISRRLLTEKKSSTEELPEFYSSPVSSLGTPFSDKGLRRTSASTNLAANIKLMEEPDSAVSVSSNQDDESDFERLCSPKPKTDDSFCQFKIDI